MIPTRTPESVVLQKGVGPGRRRRERPVGVVVRVVMMGGGWVVAVVGFLGMVRPVGRCTVEHLLLGLGGDVRLMVLVLLLLLLLGLGEGGVIHGGARGRTAGGGDEEGQERGPTPRVGVPSPSKARRLL